MGLARSTSPRSLRLLLPLQSFSPAAGRIVKLEDGDALGGDGGGGAPRAPGGSEAGSGPGVGNGPAPV